MTCLFSPRWLCGALLVVVCLAGQQANADTQLISVKSNGETLERTPNGSIRLPDSSGRVFSADARFLVFESSASNLVAEPPVPGISGIYRYDQIDDSVVAVSRTGGEVFSGQQSSLSADGQRIAFRSFERNLPGGDVLFDSRVYVQDLVTNTISLVCQSSEGQVADRGCSNPAISGDGRYVVFESSATNLVAGDSNNQADVFLRDLQNATTIRISETSTGVGGDAASRNPSIGEDSAVIAFTTASSNLDPGVANGNEQILVASQGGFTTISVGQLGVAGNADSDRAIVSSTGTHVTFQSRASNFVVVDGGGSQQVYVRDLAGASTTIVSRNGDNVAANLPSFSQSLTADGSLASFTSNASNLVTDDDPFTPDAYISSVAANSLTVLNATDQRALNLQLSSNGSYSALEAGESGAEAVTLRNLVSGAESSPRANEHLARSGNGPSSLGESRALSRDGSLVLFFSGADNLDSNDTNSATDLFLYDRSTDRATLVSRGMNGESANGRSQFGGLTGNGRFVVFSSSASNLIADDTNFAPDIFLLDRDSGTITRESIAANGDELPSGGRVGSVSEDGRFLAFSSSDNVLGASDFVEFSSGVYLRDRQLGTTLLANRPINGGSPLGSVNDVDISGDGRFVVFTTGASDLLDTPVENDQLYFFDRDNARLRLISQSASGAFANNDVFSAQVSRDGRFAVFVTQATNLVPEDTSDNRSVFLADLTTGALELISVTSAGDNADSRAFSPAISDDGQRVIFGSDAQNLSSEVRDGFEGVFLRDREAGTTTLVSLNSNGEMANRFVELAQLAGDGSHVAFDTQATNFVGAVNNASDVFLRELSRESLPLQLVSSLLPSSRAAAIDATVTVFATIIGTADLQSCRLGLGSASGVQMQYRTTDAMNAVTGAPNQLVDLTAGVPQSYLLTLTPETALPPTEIALTAQCLGSQGAQQVTGVNTLLLSAEPAQPVDIVALAATTNGDGIVDLPDDGGFGAFAVASVNVGATGTITVRPVVSGQALSETLVCATDITSGACLADPAPAVTVAVASDATPTFAVFARSDTPVAFLPAENRLNLTFEDSTGAIRGRTSVAVQ